MHDGETIDLFAPFGAFPGAPRHKNHLIGTVDNNDSGSAMANGTTPPGGGLLGKNGNTINSSGGGGVGPQQLDNIAFSGSDEDIADNVDGFLDDFLALVGSDSGSGAGGESMGGMMGADINGNGGDGNIAEDDLAWLEDMDLAAFLPPPAAPNALAGANGSLPSMSCPHEIEPLAEPAVVEEGATAAAVVPVVAAAGVGVGAAAAAAAAAAALASPAGGCMVGSSPRAGEEVSIVARDTSANAAASLSPSPAPPASAGGNGDSDGGSAAANEGGGDAAGVSRKEQLRRQKVARYLAKKKNRRWSKSKASSYQSRQRVANSRPRHKGRFLPLESDFVSIAELQRRQRALMKQMQEKAAAAGAGAPSFPPLERGASSLATPTLAAAASGSVSPLPLEFDNQVAI